MSTEIVDEIIVRPKSLLLKQDQKSIELILSENGLCIFVSDGVENIEVLLDYQTTRKLTTHLHEEYT